MISDIVEVLAAVADERLRQDERWGEQNHPDGTGHYEDGDAAKADRLKIQYAIASQNGVLNWRLILLEEVYEALAESDPERLREELIQVAAVAVAWAECIDRRGK